MSKKTPLTRRDLDAAGCGTPNCGHDHSVLYLHSRCHPEARTKVSYHKVTGTLRVRCGRCDALVAEFEVMPWPNAAALPGPTSPT